ncbi:MAG: RagB/SusD family nutrient uptake outer membrane protein [Parabacteroides sp.]|nr:RagB/SusD family nutrient uptake outer membrane protein [Parabacteroides sp.]
MIQKNIKKLFTLITCSLVMMACVELDQEPLSSVSPESYFNTDAQLQAYVNNLYDGSFEVYLGNAAYTGFNDRITDNLAGKGDGNTIWIPANYKVAQNDGDWSFNYIYKCNFFFHKVLPKYEKGEIAGNQNLVRHSIGEAYFFRAFEYFKKLQALGDFPIVTEILESNMESLTEASKRAPRTDVAHFILEDLDKAIELMEGDAGTIKTRVTQKAALLFKSRVALYEGTWLKYFNGTAFVPNGTGWPGETKEYNNGYQFPKGSIQAEINFFLDEAIDAAKKVASTTELTVNNGILPQSTSDPDNPYLKMYGDVSLNEYTEVVLWKQYDRGLGIVHNIPIQAQTVNGQTGLTRGYVDNFLMADGKPIYAATENEYKGDDYLTDVVENRDGRLQLFMKIPGQLNYFAEGPTPQGATRVEPYPDLLILQNATGYGYRKGISFDADQLSEYWNCYTGLIIFRAAEAYLNYIEAVYERHGSLDGDAKIYWESIRSRANNGQSVTFSDIETNTIQNTRIEMETPNDWGAYSAGVPLSDNTLYNIRRERRMELLGEGLRLMDLKRWRALDQMIQTPYRIEGFKVWGPMREWYAPEQQAQFSPESKSKYYLPYELADNTNVAIQGGYKWKMAHYLSPIAAEHFLITAGKSGDPSTSPIYQNPYWPFRANETASE